MESVANMEFVIPDVFDAFDSSDEILLTEAARSSIIKPMCSFFLLAIALSLLIEGLLPVMLLDLRPQDTLPAYGVRTPHPR